MKKAKYIFGSNITIDFTIRISELTWLINFEKAVNNQKMNVHINQCHSTEESKL